MIYIILAIIVIVGGYVTIMQSSVSKLKRQKREAEVQVVRYQVAFYNERKAHAETIANIRKKEEYDEQAKINAADRAKEDIEIANASDDDLLSLLQNNPGNR